MFYQPIQLKAAEVIGKNQPGLLAHLPDQTYQSGMDRLQAEIVIKEGRPSSRFRIKCCRSVGAKGC
jgi:hypothetical protein